MIPDDQDSNEKKRSDAVDGGAIVNINNTTPKRARLSQDEYSDNQSILYSDPSANIDHSQVLAYAAKNNRSSLMYLPEKDNFIGGIRYEKVLVDCGCSSILLPFPGDGSILKGKYLDKLSYYWEIVAGSKRTAGAVVHSAAPVLKIKTLMLGVGFPCTLVGKEQPRIRYLRFNLGVIAVQTILNDDEMKGMITEHGIAILNRFVQQQKQVTVVGISADAALERKYAVIGQLYLQHIIYCQAGPIGLMLKLPFEGNLRQYFGVYRTVIKRKVDAFDGFHDLGEDDDHHDTEKVDYEEEHHPVPWDDNDAYDDTIDEYDR